MGNSGPTCKQQCGEILKETKTQIERLNPFSKITHQLPYAQPLQKNIFAPKLQMQKVIDKIIESQPIKVPASFEQDESYEYDEKYWKKQHPNIVIQGNWFKRKPHGLCKIYFPDGQIIFVAYFDHGQPLFADCLVIFENGSYYHGSLRNFKFDGLGKYVHFDKNVVIEGEWKNGHPVGKVNEKVVFEGQLIQFNGQFNQQSQKQGQRCVYSIKSAQKKNHSLFEYQGGFKKDSFFGKSTIKTNNGQNLITGVFTNENIDVQKIETEKFSFIGKLDKLLSEGSGKVRINDQNIVCEGPIKNGKLNGPGTITNSLGEQQKVYWFNGTKINHMRNFDNLDHLDKLLQRIEICYSTQKTYAELTKQLLQLSKRDELGEGLQPKKSQYNWNFEMITKQKAKSIATQQSGVKSLSEKELLVELQKGKFLYARGNYKGKQ